MAAVDREERGGRASLLKTVSVSLLVILAGALGWAVLTDAPSGGEPVVVLAIPEALEQEIDSGQLPMRAAVEPDDERIPLLAGAEAEPAPDETVRIIDPSSGGDDTRSYAPIRLARAPIDALVEKTEFGPLPRIGPNGRTPAEAYARPQTGVIAGPAAPVRIAVLVSGLGISASGTAETIQRLPPEVTLAFAPYGSGLQAWVDRARSEGHEVMLQVPMEPFDFPDNDPGPHTLLTSLQADENLSRLRWLMGRFTGYFGLTNYMGAKFTAAPQALRPMFAEVAARGLAFVDDGSSPRSQAVEVAGAAGIGSYLADVTIGTGEPRERIEEALHRLETIAKERGSAVGAATALPLVVETLADWAADLDRRDVQLVPVSMLLAGGAT